jgi:uncharacterized protein (DUF362 family)
MKTTNGNSEVYSAYISKTDVRLKENLSQGLEFVKWRDHIRKDDVVFVKPNFTFREYREGVTTSPELLKHLLEVLRDRTSHVIVGESDGGNRSFKAEEAFRGHQMYDISRELGVELVNLSGIPSQFVESEIQSKKVQVQVPRMLLERVDCFVSVPVLKVHVMTEVSLGLKNLWGCYPDSMRCLHHTNLDRKLTLLAKVLNPKITVVDGLYGLNVHGPMFGNPIKMDLILVSDNIVAADALGARIMGISPRKVKHIMTAENERLGTTNVETIRINTDWRQYVSQFYTRRTLLDTVSTLLFHSETAARLVMTSPFTPLIYMMAGRLRSPEESLLANELKTYNYRM